MDFSGKKSVITGASQGIGEAIARSLAESGAEVILLDILPDQLDKVIKSFKANGWKAAAYTVDVSDLSQVEKITEAIINKHQKIDHLVNNAGITRDNLLMRMKEAEWDAVLAVNLKGVFNLTKAFIRHMIKNKYGRIVNISSVVGIMGNAGQSNYSASKAGVIGFTKSVAREIASRGITVNAVAPGYIATAMTENLDEQVKNAFIEMIPAKRFGTPEEVAQVVRFLLSDESAYITGQVININGGMLM
jgi:3-oxoacyl-[acyl-carrier protein] reductase